MSNFVHPHIFMIFAFSSSDSPATHLLWWNASSELIFFLLYQFVNFTSFVDGIYEMVMKKDLKGGRDQLMWALLQVFFRNVDHSRSE